MNERQYLIQVLLQARETISQVAKKAADGIDRLTASQEKANKASEDAAKSIGAQRQALEQIREAHIRDKKAADEATKSYLSRAEAARKNSDALREQARQIRATADADRGSIASLKERVKAYQNEAQALLDLAQARQDEIGRVDKTVTSLRRQAEAARQMASANNRLASSIASSVREVDARAAALERDARATESSSRSYDRLANAQTRASSRSERAIASVTQRIERLVSTSTHSEREVTRFGRTMERLGFSSNQASRNLRGLNAEFQGLAIALAVKYAQALITALAGLAAQLVAVAAAAAQAAAGISAALGAGAAQAIPVVGVLAASFARLAAVMKVVKLQNEQQLRASQDAQTAARAQRTAADQIANAQERVADAHRNTARAVQNLAQVRSDAAREEARAQADIARAQGDADRNTAQAQRDVTQARKDAIRTVKDLIDAEEQSVLSVEQAQAALRRAVRSGDVAGAAQAELDVRTARTGAVRARQDAAPVRQSGVEGVQAVIDAERRLVEVRQQGAVQVADAERRLADVRRTNNRQIASAAEGVADARRQEARATTDLAKTRKEAKENLDQETASANKLKDALNQLSPAERELYKRLLALQDAYKKAARPITDIITRAFSDVVDRTIGLLRDPRILSGFRKIAVEIAGAIRRGVREGSSEESIGFFQTITDEAARNIPKIVDIIVTLFHTARDLVIDALPAFRLLLDYAGDYAQKLQEFVSANPEGIKKFFLDGVRYAKQFFDLGLAVVRLFLAIGGQGGAAEEGSKTIQALTDWVDRLTQKVKDNAGQVRDFFDRSRGVLMDVIGIIVEIGKQVIRVFDPGSMSALADFLTRVVLPALGNAVQFLGILVKLFHELFSLPGFDIFGEFAATLVLMAGSLTIVAEGMAALLGVIPGFLAAFGLLDAAAIATGASIAAAVTPLGWVVLAIGAIVAAIVILNRHFHFLGPTFEWLKNAFADTWNWIKGIAKDVIDWFSDVWTQGLLKWLRWPFENTNWDKIPLVSSIVRAFINVIKFFSHGPWLDLAKLAIAPFKGLWEYTKIFVDGVLTIVGVFLDLLAGRFDEAGDKISGFWDRLRDTIAGGITTMLDLTGKLFGALGKIPKIGGPFREAADAINATKDSINQWREGLRDTGDEATKAGDKTSKFADKTEDTQKRSDAAFRGTSKSAKINFGKVNEAASDAEKAFSDLADGGRVHLRDIREVTEINMARITGSLGNKSREGKEALADNFRQAADAVKKQMDAGRISTREGMKAIRGFLAKELEVYGLSLRSARNILKGGAGGGQYGDSDNNLGREGGASLAMRAGGGIISGYGDWPHDGHMVLDPFGRPVARVSGNEGIVNPPQMERINQWGSIVKGLGLDSVGSLGELWGMRNGGLIKRFATGGQIVPVPGFPGERAARSILDEIAWVVNRFKGLILTDAYGQGHKSPGHTRFGTAADFSGPDRLMDRAVAALVRKGYLVGYDGRFGSQAWPGHGPSTVTPNFHFHVEFGGKQRDLGSALAGVATRIPRIPIRGGGDVGRYVQRTLALARVGAQRMLDRVAGSSLTTPVAGGGTRAMRPDANVVAAFRRAIRSAGASPVERLALWEAGIVESGLKNLNYGDADSLGALQERVSIYGRGHALNPFASAVRFLQEARALRPWRGSAGNLAAAVQRPAAQFRGRYDAVAGQARRYLARGGMLPRFALGAPPKGRGTIGGPITPIKGRPAPVVAPVTTPGSIRAILAPAVNALNDLLTDVAQSLEAVSKRNLRRSKDLATRLRRAFERLTEDGGTLDQIRDAVSNIATRGALRLQQRGFSVGPGGPQRSANTSEVFSAQDQLGVLQQTRTGLTGERDTLGAALADAQAGLARAQKTKNKKAAAVARAAIKNLQARLDQNTADLAQNAQDQVEAVEAFQQALLNSVNTNAEQANSSIDRWVRTAAALGQSINPNTIIDRQIGVMNDQIKGLQGVLAQALQTGNIDLATTVRGQIDDLGVAIKEAEAQQFQNAIDAVNNEASRQTSRLDRAARRAQIGGTDYAALGDTLVSRGTVLSNQRAGLLALQQQASAAGNIDQFNNLADQIDELDTTIAENTQAIKDNTDAAFNATTSNINDRFGFADTVFGGAQSFFQALTDLTGISTTGSQLSALQGRGSALATQRTGLLGQLAKLTGDQNALGLTGTDLVNYLLRISTGPSFDALMARLDPTQQGAFKDLVTTLLGNTTAITQNTKAINDLTGSDGQSFTSSFWSSFRTAVFNGAGALLPRYAMTIPGAEVGARILTSGAIMTHAGETVRPATVSRDWRGGDGGDTINLNVTSPTEVLDPIDTGRQLAFYRKTSGR